VEFFVIGAILRFFVAVLFYFYTSPIVTVPQGAAADELKPPPIMIPMEDIACLDKTTIPMEDITCTQQIEETMLHEDMKCTQQIEDTPQIEDTQQMEETINHEDVTCTEEIEETMIHDEVVEVDSLLSLEDNRWLVFPFLGGDSVELAAQGLPLCDPIRDFVTSDLITMQLEKSVGRNQIITFTDVDMKSLAPRAYVNDNVIDFWMVWLSRNMSDESASILICTSHFYSTLINKHFGVEHVFNWMLRRKVDVLSKQIILFPIEQNKHWSLVVAYYPGLVGNTYYPGLVGNTWKSISPHPRNVKPVMVHLDSLGCHDGEQLCDNLRVFFNFVWSQKKGNSNDIMFTKHSLPIIIPDGMFQQSAHKCVFDLGNLGELTSFSIFL